MSVFVPVPYCVDDDSFAIELEVWNCDATTLAFFFNIPLAIQGLFWLHINFRIICSVSLKKMDGIWIEIALNV